MEEVIFITVINALLSIGTKSLFIRSVPTAFFLKTPPLVL